MYELKVKGMTCPSCAKSMKKALLSIDSKVEVEVNLITQTVKVKSDKSEKQISELIEEAGYPVIESRKINTQEAI